MTACRCDEAYTGRGRHDPYSACDYAGEVEILADYVAKLEGATKLLSDDLYGSKDWRHGDMAERVHWLIAMLKSKSDEVDAWVDIANKNVDRIAELEARTPNVIPLIWERMVDGAGHPTSLHRAWCPLFEKYYWAERADRIPKVEARRTARIMKVIQGATNG